jgi:hypothetical protein
MRVLEKQSPLRLGARYFLRKVKGDKQKYYETGAIDTGNGGVISQELLAEES